MTSVVDFMAAVEALWTGLPPPDRPEVTYHHLDQREVDSWTVLDRGFAFGLPTRAAPAAMTADRRATLIEWVVTAQYHVARRGRGFYAFALAVANETHQLSFAVETATSWPAGISEVFVEPAQPVEEPEGAVITLTCTVLCEDT